MNSKIKVGFIGTGGNARGHGQRLLEVNEVNIEAIADISQDNRGAFLSKLGLSGVRQYDDYKEMLNETELDAIVICSPHTLHFQQAMDSLQAGCHVLIEKPMTCSTPEAKKLIEQAGKTDKVLQVSYQRHFMPEFIFIRDAIQNGEIGKLQFVTANMYQQWKQAVANTWRQNPSLSGGGMLMDSGSHMIDVLLWTTGLTPIDVRSQLLLQGTPVEIDSSTIIECREGATIGMNVSGSTPCPLTEYYVFSGEEGAIIYEKGKIQIRRFGEDPVTPELKPQTTNQDKSFIDAILGRHDVMVPGSFAQKVVELTEKIYQAGDYNVTPK